MGRERARQLRKNMTDAERALWARLRRRQVLGHKFRRQHPLGPYVVDFVCIQRKLVVEVDGGQHAEHRRDDDRRSARLADQGFAVLRFWNHEVLTDTDAVVRAIADALGPPTRPA